MKILETELKDLLIIEPDSYQDRRGFFMETWNQKKDHLIGQKKTFVQDNLSYSKCNVLRGLHYQNPLSQAKLVYVILGEVYDVAVDIRVGSKTFGRWFGIYLSADNKKQLFIPEGFAHGFCVTSAEAIFAYKCNEYYSPDSEKGLRWDDPDLEINWPIKNPIISDKDNLLPFLKDTPQNNLPILGDKHER